MKNRKLILKRQGRWIIANQTDTVIAECNSFLWKNFETASYQYFF